MVQNGALQQLIDSGANQGKLIRYKMRYKHWWTYLGGASTWSFFAMSRTKSSSQKSPHLSAVQNDCPCVEIQACYTMNMSHRHRFGERKLLTYTSTGPLYSERRGYTLTWVIEGNIS